MQKLLGGKICEKINSIINGAKIYEIRLRTGKDIHLKTEKGDIFLDQTVTEKMLSEIVSVAANNSLYAYEAQISNGYIDYRNGIRIGIVGEGVNTEGGFVSLKKIFSLCIRFPHEVIGCAKDISYLLDDFENTLIISPPGAGKTTLLREAARLLSMRYDVLIVDEREEICGKGKTLRTGQRADVMQGVPKRFVYERAIRTMAPQIVVCDELFGEEDFSAVRRIALSGVKVLASYHSNKDVSEPLKSIFRNRIILSSNPHPGSIVSIVQSPHGEKL